MKRATPTAGTTTIRAPAAAPAKINKVAVERGWKVILHNDDVTPFDLVILALQRAAGLSLEVAEAITFEAQREGVAVVKRGLTEDDAKIICGGLRKWTRVEGICPGVACEAERDDP